MRKPMQRVSLETGNIAAWFVVVAIVAFCGGWVARAAVVTCWNFPVV